MPMTLKIKADQVRDPNGRLTDEELTWIEKRTQDECPPQLAKYYVTVIAELRVRRKQDLKVRR